MRVKFRIDYPMSDLDCPPHLQSLSHKDVTIEGGRMTVEDWTGLPRNPIGMFGTQPRKCFVSMQEGTIKDLFALFGQKLQE